MNIHSIRIKDFKSLYGVHEFNFDKMKGLIKLSGPIGSGKTSIGEALIWGLYGNVKGQTNPGLVAWNCKACEVEINLTSKDKEVHIIRNIREPLIVEVNGKTLSASNKKDTQLILEEEIFDIPKLAVTKMCIISFNAFNSLASMGVGETKQFLDDIFGFKLFSEYNDEVKIERKGQENEALRLQSVYDENIEQIEHLKQKQNAQTMQLKESLNVEELQNKRKLLIDQGVALKDKKAELKKEREHKDQEFDSRIQVFKDKMTEAVTLGKQAKNHYNTFKSGICPTCGQPIDQKHIDEYKNKMEEYAAIYRENEHEKNVLEISKTQTHDSYHEPMIKCDDDMEALRKQISAIDAELKSYNDSVQLLNDNYDVLIKELEEKIKKIKEQLDKCDLEIAEWNEMNELFSKTLRYNLLETLIPHINRSIQFFINKLEQNYKIEYDQEFKAHIYVDGWDKEISYNNLSTGQRKSLDLAIIFGILQNIIANVDLNILFLDELFSNMDVNARNIMISLLQENMGDDKTIFIINHAEMGDDMFSHKIRVKLEKKKIVSLSQKKGEDVVVQASKYEQEF
jgi:DNA repair exonuclease SbcCD ATPase subunit